VPGPTFDVISAFLHESHFMAPDDVPAMLVEHGRQLGALDVALYLVDYDQRYLVPVPDPQGVAREDAYIDGTIAGRCFRLLKVQESQLDHGGRRLWVPLVDGTERLGALEFVFGQPLGAGVEDSIMRFAEVVAEIVVTKRVYGDLFEQARRRRPMSLSAELLWQLLPPLTFGSDRVIITAALAPSHDVGGDAFDYAINGDAAQFAVFDAMGHGLAAGSMATIAVAAYRNGRRQGRDLSETAAFIDEAIATHVGDQSYVTGVLAELDLPTGRLRWCIAGHPRPFILRRGRIVRTLVAGADIPFGLGTRPGVGEESLEPDDRILLYTDGITEARSADGEQFGVERFADLLSRASSEDTPPPETMRRLMHAVVEHQFESLRDDATALFVQWPGHDLDRLAVEPE
jgi:serine/threonine protein phosphatase PrpC